MTYSGGPPGPNSPPPPPPSWQQPPYPPPGPDESPRGFLSALFDFSFRRFVTPQVIPIYYGVALVVLGLMVLFGVISAIVVIAGGSPGLGLMQLIMVPVMGFVYLLLARMGLELVSNLFRIGDNVQAMREYTDRRDGA